jgi:O-antigen ligase
VAVGHGPYAEVFPEAAWRVGATVAIEAGGREMPHAHNVPLQTLVETGVIGLAALAAMWGTAFLSAWGTWRRGAGTAADLAGAIWPALLTWAAMGMMDIDLRSVCGALAWLVAGLGAASPSWAGPAAEGRGRGGDDQGGRPETQASGREAGPP